MDILRKTTLLGEASCNDFAASIDKGLLKAAGKNGKYSKLLVLLPVCPSLSKRMVKFKAIVNFPENTRQMQLSEVVLAVEQFLGSEDPTQVLAVALVLLQNESFQEDSTPEKHVRQAALQLSSMTEQQGAVAKELDSLADTEPCEFDPQHVWTLIRAIKVQSRFVDLITTATPALS